MVLYFSQHDYTIIPEFVAKGRSWVMGQLFIEMGLASEKVGAQRHCVEGLNMISCAPTTSFSVMMIVKYTEIAFGNFKIDIHF